MTETQNILKNIFLRRTGCHLRTHSNSQKSSIKDNLKTVFSDTCSIFAETDMQTLQNLNIRTMFQFLFV